MKLVFCLHVTLMIIGTNAARLNEAPDINEENGITDEKPFHPFNTVGAAAVPIIRPDKTTKSRVPDDTLLREGPSEFEVGFDSLDNHLQENALPATDQVISADLGNLHPDEVFYADDDLLIIKGGGFEGPAYVEPEQVSDNEEEFSFNEILSSPPNPHEEYNGNIPTIVRPPSNHPTFTGRPNPAYYPRVSPLALFLPAGMLANGNEPHYYYVPVQYELRHVMPSLLWLLLSHQLPLYQPPTPPRSFVGDTNVNFVNPRPPINPDAESIVRQIASAKPEKHTHSHRRRLKKPRL